MESQLAIFLRQEPPLLCAPCKTGLGLESPGSQAEAEAGPALMWMVARLSQCLSGTGPLGWLVLTGRTRDSHFLLGSPTDTCYFGHHLPGVIIIYFLWFSSSRSHLSYMLYLNPIKNYTFTMIVMLMPKDNNMCSCCLNLEGNIPKRKLLAVLGWRDWMLSLPLFHPACNVVR